ncbi:MAG: hypothetical protein HN341_00265 [Verrucomicrobia bacterium]|nr:hypothetical protein [Verrucomicrobiota bacterium]
MTPADSIWSDALDALGRGQHVCLITMVHAEGDGPNRPGARLVMTQDGVRVGTVGGGAAEHALVDAGQELLARAPASRKATLTAYDHRPNAERDASGMICSGRQVFALLRLTPDDAKTLRRIVDAVNTPVPGILSLSEDGLLFRDADALDCVFEGFDADAWCYTERIGSVDGVTLVGGGHVSLALSPLLVSVGMRVVVLDNRAGLDSMGRNLCAYACRVIDYADVASHVPSGDRSYACIMTFGHRDDEAVLSHLVGKRLRYLGMMGSLSKIEQIKAKLLAQGVAGVDLDRVHAPIGLPIGSNTPEEIAISIAAEIVAVRNGVGR